MGLINTKADKPENPGVLKVCTQFSISGKSGDKKCKAESLLRSINLILQLIISNSISLNKFTSPAEISEHLQILTYENKNETDSESENYPVTDIDGIRIICETLCIGHGVLIKIKKNDTWYYKLNYQNYQ